MGRAGGTFMLVRPEWLARAVSVLRVGPSPVHSRYALRRRCPNGSGRSPRLPGGFLSCFVFCSPMAYCRYLVRRNCTFLIVTGWEFVTFSFSRTEWCWKKAAYMPGKSLLSPKKSQTCEPKRSTPGILSRWGDDDKRFLASVQLYNRINLFGPDFSEAFLHNVGWPLWVFRVESDHQPKK